MEIDQLVGGMGGVGTKKWEGGVEIQQHNYQHISALFEIIRKFQSSRLKVYTLQTFQFFKMSDIFTLNKTGCRNLRNNPDKLGMIQTILKRFIMDLAERKRERKKKGLISCPCSRVLQVF